MHTDALLWSEEVLRSRITAASELSGGLTSTMLALTDETGRQSVLRLMTNEPWRTHGFDLTHREASALQVLGDTAVPAPVSLGLDATGRRTGVAAHLMSRLPGTPTIELDSAQVTAMATLLAVIHEVTPSLPFRTYQSWAWEAKRVIPAWTKHADSWQRGFDLLAEPAPPYRPTFLHRDFSHRNLLWTGSKIAGVVDWVETSTGPACLDAAHAATNLALAFGPAPARSFLQQYAALTGREIDRYWLMMDAIGFLPPPGRDPLFGSAGELESLDHWLQDLVAPGQTPP
ncbi:aminoglycoside phosphotransferase family protein [Kribbella antibiotica]|uniref:Aminoglycoside phosphotransferase family protein n=1 Tax=Kribbella antibiotica TaxID=190195 RepID=A0A4R4YTC8_9ACTN|nr:aminoglycoside phosphotransferase family protein [Kribbella antibiotica]TDD47674.1 aminoglycoside phosphotransferase family protein [Kribbella antibiotica]